MARINYRPGFFRRPHVTDWVSFLVAAAFGLISIALLFGVGEVEKPYLALAPFIGLGVTLLLWRFPLLSVFGLMVAATLFEFVGEGDARLFTIQLGFWSNLSKRGISGGIFSPAEILLVAGLVIWFLRGLFSQTLEFRWSPLLRTYGLYLGVVIVGYVYGILNGGDARIGLYEIRPLVYVVPMFFLAINLLRTKRHIETLGWIIILGTGIKGIQGSWAYLVTFGRNFEGNSLLDHDEAVFFPAYYVFLILMFVFGGDPRQKRVALYLLPWVIVADFANKRRSSTGALLVGLVVLLFILFTILQRYRLHVLRGSIIALVLISIYSAAFWNSNSRFAQPLRAIRSQIAPDSRDASSDLYRVQENENLMYGIRQNPILGIGYGIRMQNVSGMVDLSNVTDLLFYMPHNSILWIWWRLGLSGFVLFWTAMGAAIIRNCFLARSATDPYVRRWAIFAVIVVIMSLLMGWWDLGVLRYRIVAYCWIVLAAAEVLQGMAQGSAAPHAAKGVHA